MSGEFFKLVLAPRECEACSECEGEHHWSEATEDQAIFMNEEPLPMLVGLEIWFECKHCEAWTINPEAGSPVFLPA